MEMSVKPHREAGFRVLRSPDVPSVLVELGYLSSKRDLDLLLSDEWRTNVTGQMAGAIEAFFAARLPPAVTARGAEAPRIGKAAQIAPAQIGPAPVSP
ncbi:N-acetylmuramoyl-L-alanine amidase family protein, partial [Methylobacterium frigidaeris]